MKAKLLLVAICSLLTMQVEAQGLLKQLGKAVGREVVNHVADKISEKKSGKSTKQEVKTEVQTTQTQSSSQAVEQSTSSSAPVALVAKDMGQNIPREAGLDYVDEYGINHGGGILIGGVLWAPVNCGYHATDYPYGKLYQWGRRHGQGYGAPYEYESSNINPDKTTAEIVPGPVTPAEARKHPNRFYARSDMAIFNWTKNDMKLWNNFTDNGIIFKNRDNDPCPEGWRLPDLFDIYSLMEHYSAVVESPEGGITGVWFSGPNEYSTNVPRIFLPIAGYRTFTGNGQSREKEACYWTLRHGGGEGLVWHLYFRHRKVQASPHAYPHEAYSVRCVKDIKGQVMR